VTMAARAAERERERELEKEREREEDEEEDVDMAETERTPEPPSSSSSDEGSERSEFFYNCRPPPSNVPLNAPDMPSTKFAHFLKTVETLSMIDHVEKGVPIRTVCKVFNLPEDEILRRVCSAATVLRQVVDCLGFDAIGVANILARYDAGFEDLDDIMRMFRHFQTLPHEQAVQQFQASSDILPNRRG